MNALRLLDEVFGTDSPNVRPDSPAIRPAETRMDSASSPNSPLSPRVAARAKELTDRARLKLGWTDADVTAFLTEDVPRGGPQWALSALAELLAFVARERANRHEAF